MSEWSIEAAEALLRTDPAGWRGLELRSQSRIADIETCPMRARLRYHPDRHATAVGEIAGRAADLGTACHELLLAPLEGREPSPEGFDADVWAEADALVEACAEWVYSRLLPRGDTYSIECSNLPDEYRITKDYGDGRPQRNNFIVPVSEKYAICGAWDQCGVDPAGYCRIPDVKSGRVRNAGKLSLQGQWYTFAAWAAYPVHDAYIFDPVFLRFRSWTSGTIGFERKDMGELRRLIVQRIERADALLDEARPRPNEYCGSCPLQRGCTVAQAEIQGADMTAPSLQFPADWPVSDDWDEKLKRIISLGEAGRERIKAWRLAQVEAGGVVVDGMTPVLRSKVGRWEIPIAAALPIVTEAGIPAEEVFACKSKTALEALTRKDRHPEWKDAIKRICALKVASSYKDEIDWIPAVGAEPKAVEAPLQLPEIKT